MTGKYYTYFTGFVKQKPQDIPTARDASEVTYPCTKIAIILFALKNNELHHICRF